MRYRVKALSTSGGVAVLDLEAADAQELDHLVRQQGLRLISAQVQRRLPRVLLRRQPRFALVLFAQQLVALLQAGLGTVDALEALSREQRGVPNEPLVRLLEQVRQGHTLSHALQAQPQVFPPLFVATVRASERTGDLQEALRRYVAYHEQVDRLRNKVKSAAIYPAVLAVTGALVTGFLMFYVVPRFSAIYDDIGGQLPWLSQLLMHWGRLLSTHAWAMGLAMMTLLGVFGWFAMQSGTRQWLIQRLWAIPRLGEMLRIYQLARLYRTLGMLLRSGTPLVSSMAMTDGLLDDSLRGALRVAQRQISEGQPVSDTFGRHGLATPVALSMLRVGERSGELGAMMDRVAALYDDELARWVDVATRLVEPLLMVLIGVLVGLIVVLLYLPVFELASSLT